MNDTQLIALANHQQPVFGWSVLSMDACWDVTTETHLTYDAAVAARQHYPVNVDDEDDPDFAHTVIVATRLTFSDEED